MCRSWALFAPQILVNLGHHPPPLLGAHPVSMTNCPWTLNLYLYSGQSPRKWQAPVIFPSSGQVLRAVLLIVLSHLDSPGVLLLCPPSHLTLQIHVFFISKSISEKSWCFVYLVSFPSGDFWGTGLRFRSHSPLQTSYFTEHSFSKFMAHSCT